MLALAAAVTSISGSIRAQEGAAAGAAALGADEAKLRWVDGRPMLRVTLRAGDKVYYCHLLVDLATTRPLFLHRNAAGSLRAQEVDIEAGGIKLAGLSFEADRDTWLEGLTAAFAEELQQVPVAGIVGLGAFGERDVVLDGPAAVLRLRPPTGLNDPAPPVSATLGVASIAGDLRKGLRLQADLGKGLTASLVLHTRDPFSWMDPGLCKQAGHADGVLSTASVGTFVDFAKWAPFRPLRAQSDVQGGIGGAVLRQLVLTVQPAAGRLLVGMPNPPAYPEIEAAFQRAAFGSKDPAALQQFLEQHAEAPQAAEAAAALLERQLEQDGDLTALQFAGLAVVKSAAKNKKGTAALEVLEQLPGTREAFAARAAIAEAGLAESRADEDGTATHKLRLELGTQQRILGDLKEARRHLLSAVFGMPTSGAANLQLGHWHRDQGQFEASLGRYFLAMLDMKNFGQEGYAAFAQAFAKLRPDGDLLAELEDRADGRVPSFQPIPRDPATVKKTGRAVLVELFTGAMCPPCVAADVGCDGLTQLYDRDEVVVVQWHLPVPAPEPMVAPVSLERAEKYGVRSTPTVVIAGGDPIVGGGKVDAAPDLFRRYCQAADAQLAQAPQLQIDGTATRSGSTLRVAVQFAPTAAAKAGTWRAHVVLVEALVAFPGANGLLFHHGVARSGLTPGGGAPVAQVAGSKPLELSLDLRDVAKELDAQVATYETEKPFLVRPVEPEPERLAIVVFVQDASGAVLQTKLLPVTPEAGR